MNRFRILVAIMMLSGCGDDSAPSTCPDGLVQQGDRCVALDAGLPDGCLSEELCNGMDDDCDGMVDEGISASTFYADADEDGAGDRAVTCEACDVSVCQTQEPDTPWVEEGNDCDDTCDTCFPGAPELCDVIDNDCDALTDESASNTYYADVDGDGYGVTEQVCSACDTESCEPLDEGVWVEQPGDCDDACDTCYPGAVEVCDGLDNTCEGAVDEGVTTAFYADADGDTHGDRDMSCEACTAADCGAGEWVTLAGDCDDSCPTCFPGGTEVCDSLDNDCAGGVDNGLDNTFYRDRDEDGYGSALEVGVFCGTTPPDGWASNGDDCNDADSRAYPGGGYQSTPMILGSAPGGAFDFNCDGMEEARFDECGPQRCGATIVDPRSPSCYVAGTPGCGNPRMRWTCSCGVGGCNEVITTEDQPCR